MQIRRQPAIVALGVVTLVVVYLQWVMILGVAHGAGAQGAGANLAIPAQSDLPTKASDKAPAGQDVATRQSGWLLSVVFKLETMRERANADIRQYDGNIQRCNATIAKSDNLIGIAQQKDNAKMEAIAREASSKAQEAKAANVGLKTAAENRKARAEYALAHVQNALADAGDAPRKIKAVIADYSGRVAVQKASGESFELGATQSPVLEKGDSIATYGNSRVELQCLDGRGSLQIGEFSQVKMEADDAGLQALRLLQGKVNISVESLEKYQKSMAEKIKAYQEDLKTVNDATAQQKWQALEDEYQQAKAKAKGMLQKKLEVRTPSAVSRPAID